MESQVRFGIGGWPESGFPGGIWKSERARVWNATWDLETRGELRLESQVGFQWPPSQSVNQFFFSFFFLCSRDYERNPCAHDEQ